MRGLKVVLIIFALILLSASASAQSLLSQLDSLMSLSSSSTCDPVNMFSSVPQMTSMISGFPTDGSFFQSTGSSPYNQIVDQSFQWPGPSYNKWTAHGITPPSTYTQPSGNVSQDSVSSPEAQAWANAPAITQVQKDKALKIAATSPLCAQYNTYPDESWTCNWGSPYDGHTIQVFPSTGNSQGTDVDFFVNIDDGTIVNSYVNPTF